MNVTTLTRANGDVEVHKAGCRDLAKYDRGYNAHTFDFPTKWHVWYDYSADFLAEGGGAYDLDFKPCTAEMPDGPAMDEHDWYRHTVPA